MFLMATGVAESAEFIQLYQSQSLPLPSSAGATLLKRPNQSDLTTIKKYPNHERFQQLIDGIPVTNITL